MVRTFERQRSSGRHEIAKKTLAFISMVGAFAVPAALANDADSNRHKIPRTPSAIDGPERKSPNFAGLEGAGFSSGPAWQTDREAVQEEYDRLKETNSDTVLIVNPYTQGGDNVDKDAERLCTAIPLADENELDVVLRTEHRYRGGGKDNSGKIIKSGELGYMPTGPGEYRAYLTAMYDMFSTLFGENGCAQEVDKIYLSPYNEPDSSVFNRVQVVAGRRVAAENLVEFYKHIYKPLHRYADEFGVDLEIIGGEVRQQNVKIFLAEMKQAMKSLKVSGSIIDIYAQHYYLKGPDKASQDAAINHITITENAVEDTFGSIPIWYTEVGAISTIDESKQALYRPLPPNIVPLNWEAHARFYDRFARAAACEGVGRVILWQLVDDGSILRTGPFNKDKSKKPSHDPIAQSIETALTGQVEC